MVKQARIRGRFQASFTELIRRTACDLPRDVESAMRRALDVELVESRAAAILGTILENVRLARTLSTPMCQDTGTPTFTVLTPIGCDTTLLIADLRAAVAQATGRGFLRHNTIESLSGDSIDNNLGETTPLVHQRAARRTTFEASLLLKGGGCENVSRQYSLPDVSLGAGRDLEGVWRCVLDAIWQAQGCGCAPGILGVCIGGDRATGYAEAKEVLWRKIGVRSRDPRLAELEERLLRESVTLGIGPMGMGGQTALLDVKLCCAERLPASYFVTVAYMCWACRRRRVVLTPQGEVLRWGT